MDVQLRPVLAGRYELGPVIGRGGMAEVRRAFDRRLRRTVAVKCFDPVASSTPQGRARFEAEARAGGSVVHPDAVMVFDVGVDRDTPFIVMECLPGRTLADEIAAGPMAVGRVVRVVAEVCSALTAAHDTGFLHRDVKPSNVLFTDDGRAKLADFGIAAFADRADLTRTGLVLGTPAYLAPERLAGRPATVRSEVYSVGVVTYEALTGRRAFDGESAVSIAYAVHYAPVPPLGSSRPDLPARLEAVVARAMDRDDAARFADPAAYAEALARAANRSGACDADDTMAIDRAADERTRVLPAAARHPRDVTRSLPSVRRARVSLFGVVAVLALLTAAIAASFRDASPDTDRRPREATTSTLAPALVEPFDALERTIDG